MTQSRVSLYLITADVPFNFFQAPDDCRTPYRRGSDLSKSGNDLQQFHLHTELILATEC